MSLPPRARLCPRARLTSVSPSGPCVLVVQRSACSQLLRAGSHGPPLTPRINTSNTEETVSSSLLDTIIKEELCRVSYS